MFRARSAFTQSHQFLELESGIGISIGRRRNEKEKIPVRSRAKVIAIVGHQRVAERVETRGNFLPPKISRGLRKMYDADQDGFSQLRVYDAFHILFCLCRNALAHPQLAGGRRAIEREAISLCVEHLPCTFRDRVVGQWPNGLHLTILGGAEQRENEDEGDRKRWCRNLAHFLHL